MIDASSIIAILCIILKCLDTPLGHPPISSSSPPPTTSSNISPTLPLLSSPTLPPSLPPSLPLLSTVRNFSSFQRLLNLHGFRRSSSSSTRDAYFHPLFLQSQRHLVKDIIRIALPVDTAGEGSGTGTGTGTGPSTGESSSRRKEGLNLVDMIIRFRNLHLNALIILVWNGCIILG